MTVLAAVTERPGQMSLKEFDLPEIGDNDGLLRVEMCGVCSGDPKIFQGLAMRRDNSWPMIMGHEFVGYIEEIGSVAAHKWGVNKGDHVILEPSAGCGECHECLSGNYRFCKNVVEYGLMGCQKPPHLWGGYSQYLYLHPKARVHRISQDLPASIGILIAAVIADEIRWLCTRGGVKIGDVIVIEGMGPQGLVAAAVAKESGASTIIMTGLTRDKVRFELAQEFGANHFIDVEKEEPVARIADITGGNMADVVIDLTGSEKVPNISIDLVKSMGTIVGASVTGLPQVTLNIDKITLKEINYLGVFTCDAASTGRAIALAESRKYPFEKLLTHEYPLKDAATAIIAAEGKNMKERPIKVAVNPWSS